MTRLCVLDNDPLPNTAALRTLESLYRKIGIEMPQVLGSKHVEALIASGRKWDRIDVMQDPLHGGALGILTDLGRDIWKWRGSPSSLKGSDKYTVMPTLSPEYCQKDQTIIPAVLSDLSKSLIVPEQHYETNPTLEQLEDFNAETLSVDIEINRFTEQITMVGFTDKAYHAIVVPFRGAYIPQIKRILAGVKTFVGQNCIAFDIPRLETAGVKFRDDMSVWDTMLMHHLVQPNLPHDLGFIASIFAQMRAWKHLNVVDMPWYCGGDVDATLQSFQNLYPVLKHQKLVRLYQTVQIPMQKICAQMSATGIKVDPNRIKQAREKFLLELHELEAILPKELQPYDKSIRVRKSAPAGTLGKSGKPIKFIHVPGTEHIIPWDSPQAVGRYLYDTLKLPKQLHAKTKKVTSDKTALDRLYKRTGLPALDAIRKVRSLGELLSTFLKEENDEANIAVGRVHSSFLLHGTCTGRLASSGPNMQNIPPRARFIYVPSFADWCFVEGDFSSLENRLAAWYANDIERLSRLADPNFNEHRWLASKLFGIPESELTKESPEYKKGKCTNHGADGAMGPRKLAQTYDMTEKEARDLIFKWRTINHRSAKWQEEVGNEAVAKGVLTNAFGRKGYFYSDSGYTEGIRFNPQSTGADLCFRTMIGLCYANIDWPIEKVLPVVPIVMPLPEPARLVLQVHDSLLVECPFALREQVIECMKTVMSQPWPELAGLSIPVDIKVGNPSDSWAELTHIK